MRELETLWWNQWIKQALPYLAPFKRWRTEHRPVRVGDIVLVGYDNRMSKGDYRLARVLEVYPDVHNVVRTVKVGMRKRNQREPVMPYVAGQLDELRLGVQRLAVIYPIEDQERVEPVVEDG